MRRLIASLIVGSLLVVLSACAPQPPEPIDVQLTLTDFGIESSLTTFDVGQPYHVVISNQGGLNHELMIMEPLMGGMEMSMEEMDEMALAMVEEDDMPPGSTQTLDITFSEEDAASDLEFACHVSGHYEQGMNLPITIVP